MTINDSLFTRARCRNYDYRVSIVILSFILGALFPQASSAENSTAATPFERYFKGTDSATTESFTVEDGWEVIWETESTYFQLSAYGVNDPLYKKGTMTEQEQIVRSFEIYQPIILANSSHSSGKASHALGGTFYLKVKASGRWTIHLKAIKPTKDYLDVPYTGAP